MRLLIQFRLDLEEVIRILQKMKTKNEKSFLKWGINKYMKSENM